MTQTLEDMRLVVTGAASGIGRAIALEAANRGARRLVATDVNGDGLADLSAALPPAAEVICVAANLADAESAEKIAERARTAFGGIDGLVNAAGITNIGLVTEDGGPRLTGEGE